MLRTLTRKVMLLVVCYVVLSVLAALVISIRIVHNYRLVSHLSAVTLQHTALNGHFSNDLNRTVAEAASYARTHERDDRDEARTALAAAQTHLAALGKLADVPDLSAAEQSLLDQLHARRSTLLGAVERNITALLGAVDVGDDRAVASALDSLNATEAETEAIHHTAELFLEADAAAATQIFSTELRRGLVAVGAALTLSSVVVIVSFVFVRRKVVQPLRQLSQAATDVAQGQLDREIAVTSEDEIGVLQHAFNRMVADLRAQRTAAVERSQTLERLLDTQQQLLETVRELSTPLLPVLDGVVVLPLVGHIDTQRADAIMQTLLNGVSRRRARVAIVDVTGVAVLDTHVVQLLLQAIRATELLGAQVLLAGITAAMAQVVVAQGLDFGALRTYRDLRSAVEAVLATETAAAAGMR